MALLPAAAYHCYNPAAMSDLEIQQRIGSLSRQLLDLRRYL